MDEHSLSQYLYRYHQVQRSEQKALLQSGAAPTLAAQVEADLAWEQADPAHHLLTPMHPAYPARLRAIPDPPELLYVKGVVDSLSSDLLAMVGSRRPSASGVRLARRFAGALWEQGLAISSGLALGIDAESHQGALDAGGVTIAVLGSGLDNLYPPQHRTLAERICEQGALVSEFPRHAAPLPWRFPQRNRIVTGLSLGVLVVEASLRSGSLVSARCALEQGREVFAIPGHIDNPAVKGCHWLLRQGATLVEDVADIMEELPGFAMARERDSPQPSLFPAGLAEDEQAVLALLGDDSVLLEQLLRETELPAPRLQALLMALEVKGLVSSLAGRYQRLRP